MGTFGRLVFCEVRTQIVGKTQFFDSLWRAEKLRSPFSQPVQPSATADGYLPLSVMTARILQPVSAVSEVPAT